MAGKGIAYLARGGAVAQGEAGVLGQREPQTAAGGLEAAIVCGHAQFGLQVAAGRLKIHALKFARKLHRTAGGVGRQGSAGTLDAHIAAQ